MKPKFNVCELEEATLRLQGCLPPEELELGDVDELVHLQEPLVYDLEVQRLEDSLLVQGTVRVVLACECARCLRPFSLVLEWPRWTTHLPLKGEDCVKLEDGEADLTPFLREDTLLRFPQHPLCQAECGGIVQPQTGKPVEMTGSGTESGSVWSALNQLKLK